MIRYQARSSQDEYRKAFNGIGCALRPKHNSVPTKRKREFLGLVFGCVILSNSALGQMKSGTVITVFFSQNKVVFAGDSRLTITGDDTAPGKKIYSDEECKVFALDNKVLFAATGISTHGAFSSSGLTLGEGEWSSHAEAVKSAATESDVVSVATAWANRMKKIFESDVLRSDNAVRSVEKDGNLLSTGIFAGLMNNKLSVLRQF